MDDGDDTAGDIQQSAVLRLHLGHQVAARPGQCSVAGQLYSYRFIYVRSSLQENIQRVLKRNSFTFSFLALGLFISIFNVAGKLHLKRFCRTNDNQFFQCSFTSRESKQELTVWGLSSTEPAWILSLAGAPPSSR